MSNAVVVLITNSAGETFCVLQDLSHHMKKTIIKGIRFILKEGKLLTDYKLLFFNFS